jgi:two-component system, NtrC family, sensor kinase
MLVTNNGTGLQKALRGLIEEEGFAFAHITNEVGHWLYEQRTGSRQSSKPSPLSDRAMRGRPGMALELFSREDLLREDEALLTGTRIEHREAAAGEDAKPVFEERALVMRGVYPIRDAQGRTLALLDGGVLVNGNKPLIDDLRDRVYSAGTLPAGGIGAVALLLDDLRVATNFPFG